MRIPQMNNLQLKNQHISKELGNKVLSPSQLFNMKDGLYHIVWQECYPTHFEDIYYSFIFLMSVYKNVLDTQTYYVKILIKFLIKLFFIISVFLCM